MVYIDGVGYEGAGITSKAFAQYIPFSNIFLTIAVVLFAVSTMISWSYYGLQANPQWTNLTCRKIIPIIIDLDIGLRPWLEHQKSSLMVVEHVILVGEIPKPSFEDIFLIPEIKLV